jgi:hypothetical protein
MEFQHTPMMMPQMATRQDVPLDRSQHGIREVGLSANMCPEHGTASYGYAQCKGFRGLRESTREASVALQAGSVTVCPVLKSEETSLVSVTKK